MLRSGHVRNYSAMPNTETRATPGMVYRPSTRRADLPKQSFLWNASLQSEMNEGTALHSPGSTASALNTGLMTTETLRPVVVPARKLTPKLIDEELFDARAMAKIAASRISMYLREGWRDRLFYQLDQLLAPEEWDPDDKPLQAQSFDTFLKAICDVNPTKRPGLGLSYAGNLIAAWRSNLKPDDRISLEFMPNGKVKLIGSRFVQEDTVTFSALTPVSALKQTLADLSCSDWLGCEKS